MKMMTKGFQLEKKAPGSFLVQGFAAGIVSVFVITTAFVVWDNGPYCGVWIFFLPFFLLLGGGFCTGLGVLPWYLSGDDGYEMNSPQRVGTAGGGLCLFAFLLAFYLGSEVMNSLRYWLCVLMMGVTTGGLLQSV